MRASFRIVSLLILLLSKAEGVTAKVHVITFGKWMNVSVVGGDEKAASVKTRALVIDGKVKEYMLGAPHEVTERLFVVRRVFRLNDSLPEEAIPQWQWQRGGWVMVDRNTGRVSPMNLPEFDVAVSAVSWYRDYAAYCGVGEDGKKSYAIVAQLGRRKPVLRKALAEVSIDGADSACLAPVWQRGPTRVSFEPEEARSRRLRYAGTWWMW